MRIIKDVIISGSIEPIWAQVVSEDRLNITASGGDGDAPHPYEIFEVKAPTRLSYRSIVSGHPVITTIELSQKGKRTSLRVIVTGWEKVGHERAKAEMPKISMEWEKVLGSIKRDIESSTK